MRKPRQLDWDQAWAPLWQRLHPAVDRSAASALKDALLSRHAEPQRHYHTLQHLGECLELWAGARHLAEHPEEVALALWFHDAVYEPGAADNELRSAQWALEALVALGVPTHQAQNVHDLVLMTRHPSQPRTPDACCLVDVDLAILGAEPARFAQYEAQIRAEYAFVDEAAFAARRAKLLNGFLAQPAIYTTPHFQQMLEARARSNLRGSLERLAAAGGIA